ncbi:hypothetical protein ACLB1N_00725 [Escherichia coli]
MKLEGESWRNRTLRKGQKQENRHEFEPQYRLRIEIARKSSLYGVAEAELKNKTRGSGKPEEHKTRLELTQGYLGEVCVKSEQKFEPGGGCTAMSENGFLMKILMVYGGAGKKMTGRWRWWQDV